MKIATVKTDERIMRPWVQIAKRHGEVVVIDSEGIKDFVDLLHKLQSLQDDVLYSHSVMALHNPKCMLDLLGRYDCVLWRQKGNPAVSLSIMAITRAGLDTVVEFAETQFVVDETISQEANCHNLLLQALGQRCVMLQDQQTNIVESLDGIRRGTVGTYVGSRQTMELLHRSRLDVYDILGVLMDNLTVEDRKGVQYE